MSRLVVELNVPGLFDDAHFTECALVANCLCGLFNFPGVVDRNWACKHQRRTIIKGQSARRHSQAHGARANKRNREWQRRILIVFRTRKFSGTSTREADVDLIERQSSVAQISIPLQCSLAGCRIEVLQVAADEVNVLHLLEVLAYVDSIAEHLCLKV